MALWQSSDVLALLIVSLVCVPASLSGAPVPLCKDDADCAFAGSCAGGHCDCRSPWTGPRCSALALAPMESGTGLRLAQNWTWGGSVIRGDDAHYHMFVMHLKERCGIQCCEPARNFWRWLPELQFSSSSFSDYYLLPLTHFSPLLALASLWFTTMQ
eukprot:COSAG02_NODE_173_length_31245_cov_413.548096_27_plen_157_part_00